MIAGLFKTFLRVGVIGAACAGVAALIAGEARVRALFSQAQQSIVETIDSRIDDPVALRAQLRELEREYPARIAQVRGDLAELVHQLGQLEREQAISERVVALADEDLTELQPLVQQAQQAMAERAAFADGSIQHVVALQFDNRTLSLDQAGRRLEQIGNTRVAYANRAAGAAHDLVYLRQQAERLQELLGQLETERSQFQDQLGQLDRQVDAIARNEKLIEMLEKRKRTIEECSRYEAISLDHVVTRLDEVKARQQAELDLLTTGVTRTGYEDVARMQLDAEDVLAPRGAGPVLVTPAPTAAIPPVETLLFTQGAPVRR